MKVFHQYGSKDRLFEMMQKVNGIVLSEGKKSINESILPKEKRLEIIKTFIDFVDSKLNLGDNMPEIIISYDGNEAKEMLSFGKNTPALKEIVVVDKNRNLADTIRTLGHELKHTDQFIKGELTPNSGNDGSEQENEANAFAGVIMREFAKKYPIIFE
jgi:Zn-dependent peptidase ImmA (M78 family)